MRFSHLLSLLLIPALAAGLNPVNAQSAKADARKVPRQSYWVLWAIDPDPRIEAPKWVEPYSSVASARLVPPTAYVVDQDVRTAEGKLLVPAGTEMAGLLSEALLACTMHPPALKGLQALKWLGSHRYVCLMDEDRNGSFDRYFWMGTPAAGVPIGRGRVPRKRNPISDIPYTVKEPKELTTLPRIHVRYGWFASLVDTLIFQVCFAESGYHNDGTCLVERADVKRSALPQTFSLLGGKFQVTAKEGNRVQVQMLEPLAPQPLLVSY